MGDLERRGWYLLDNINLYLGDNREILRDLPTGAAHLLITDPPYGVSYISHMSRYAPTKPIHNDHDLGSLAEIIPQLDRVMAHDSHLYIFCSWRKIQDTIDLLPWELRNIIIWDKGDGGTAGDLRRTYSQNWEVILFCCKGDRFLRNNPRPRALIRVNWNATYDTRHPTSKPVELMKRLILQSSLPGETVLDPFMGSGPVVEAAIELGRGIIGIEIDPLYYDRAVKRSLQRPLAGGILEDRGDPK